MPCALHAQASLLNYCMFNYRIHVRGKIGKNNIWRSAVKKITMKLFIRDTYNFFGGLNVGDLGEIAYYTRYADYSWWIKYWRFG